MFSVAPVAPRLWWHDIYFISLFGNLFGKYNFDKVPVIFDKVSKIVCDKLIDDEFVL